MIEFDAEGMGQYDPDADLETQRGIVVDFNGRKLRLLRAGGANKRFDTLTQRLTAAYRRMNRIPRGEDIPPEAAEEISRKVMAETVVIGWEGVESGGAAVPFSVENCIAFFKRFPEVLLDAMTIASNRASFQEEFARLAEEELGKN